MGTPVDCQYVSAAEQQATHLATRSAAEIAAIDRQGAFGFDFLLSLFIDVVDERKVWQKGCKRTIVMKWQRLRFFRIWFRRRWRLKSIEPLQNNNIYLVIDFWRRRVRWWRCQWCNCSSSCRIALCSGTAVVEIDDAADDAVPTSWWCCDEEDPFLLVLMLLNFRSQ